MQKRSALIVLPLCIMLLLSRASADAPARGVWENAQYTNTYADICMTLPPHWAHGTDEDLSRFAEQGEFLLMLSGTISSQDMPANLAIYDMLAIDTRTMDSVTVLFSALDVYSTSMTENNYLANLRNLLLETYPYKFQKVKTVAIGSQGYRVMEVFHEALGITQFYAVRKVDDYMIVMIFTAKSDLKLKDFVEMFS